jgi:hypothetical protein
MCPISGCHNAGAFHPESANTGVSVSPWWYLELRSAVKTPWYHSFVPRTDLKMAQPPAMR